MKKITYIILIIFCLFMSYFWQNNEENLHLVACDVGQGDAILLWEGSRQMLIDAGPDQKVLECLEEFMPWWDRKLEIVLATHPDADHIGGLASVFRHYGVGLFVTNGDEKQTAVFSELEGLIQREEHSPNKQIIVSSGQQLSLSPRILIKVMSPLVGETGNSTQNDQFSETILSDSNQANSSNKQSYNNRSITLFVMLDGVKVLLMADLEKAGEIALIKRGLIQDVDIQKIAHHGSKSSTSPQFLELSLPEISLLSVGKDNQYGHPSPQVLATLADFGSKIYRTDQLGHLHFVVNGLYYWYEPKQQFFF